MNISHLFFFITHHFIIGKQCTFKITKFHKEHLKTHMNTSIPTWISFQILQRPGSHHVLDLLGQGHAVKAPVRWHGGRPNTTLPSLSPLFSQSRSLKILRYSSKMMNKTEFQWSIRNCHLYDHWITTFYSPSKEQRDKGQKEKRQYERWQFVINRLTSNNMLMNIWKHN